MPKEKNNKLIIAAAGSGKTEYVVKQSLEILQQNCKAKILITTYTDNNEQELRQRFIKINKHIPKNITIQTWLSFLFNHGAKPYKFSAFQKALQIDGILPPDFRKTNRYLKSDTEAYYFVDGKFYRNELSPFVIRCNEKSNGMVVERLKEIYTHIFIDEVQDLAGPDLDILQILLNSKMQIIGVGDIRQHTYSTNDGNKNSGYNNIKEFVIKKCKNIIEIDENTLQVSHRNNQQICDFANKLYPSLEASKPCNCNKCRIGNEHIGVYLIKRTDINAYLQMYGNTSVQLRHDVKTSINANYPVYNFGQSKGQTFDRVLIYPTTKIIQYLKDGKLTTSKKILKGKLKGKIQEIEAFDIAKFYVAITRARYSVCIVIDDSDFDNNFIAGVSKLSITPPHKPPQEP